MKKLDHLVYMTVTEAEKKGIHRNLIYYWIKEGRLPYLQVKPHSQIFLKRKHVERIINNALIPPIFEEKGEEN